MNDTNQNNQYIYIRYIYIGILITVFGIFCLFNTFDVILYTTATSQSATNYTAIYTGVGTFVVTTLMCVCIVLATLRYDFIFYLLITILSLYYS